MKLIIICLTTVISAQMVPPSKIGGRYTEERQSMRTANKKQFAKNGPISGLRKSSKWRPPLPPGPLDSLADVGTNNDDGISLTDLFGGLMSKPKLKAKAKAKAKAKSGSDGTAMSSAVFEKVKAKRLIQQAGEIKQQKIKENEAIITKFEEEQTKEDLAGDDPGIFSKLTETFFPSMLTARRANGGRKEVENPELEAAKIQADLLAEQSNEQAYLDMLNRARCPDMFSLMSQDNKFPDKKLWTERIPVFKTGLIGIKFFIDQKNGPIEYSKETENICDGRDGRNGDICELTCPKLVKFNGGYPIGQTDYDGDGKTNKFICSCSINPQAPEDFVCYWKPLENQWKRHFTCDRKRNMKNSPTDQFRLITWWNASPHSFTRWEYSVGHMEKFLKEPTTAAPRAVVNLHNARPHLFSNQYQEDNDDDSFLNIRGEWPEEEELINALETDSQYQILQSKLDMLDAVENKSEMQRFEHQRMKKMVHLGALIQHYQLDGGKAFENFFRYGCYCMSSDHELHKGIGAPADPIDTACREHDVCMKCAGLDSYDKCHPYRGYQFAFERDEETGKIIHTCTDTDKGNIGYANTCRKTLCECDKILVKKLVDYADTYSTNFHYGSFDYGKNCVSNCKIDQSTGRCVKHDSCCNDNNNSRKPFSSDGGKKKCCVNNVYDSTEKVCCDGVISDTC